MRSKVVKTLALALVLGGVGLVMGQQGGLPPSSQPKQKAPPEKSKLEEMLAEALKNNPDIRVAAAKLAEADAELNRTRVQVTQKVVTLHHAILSQKAAVVFAQKKYDRMKALQADRAIDSKLVDEAFGELTVAKAKLEELQAQMPALLGKTPQAEKEVTLVTGYLDRLSRLQMMETHQTAGPMADKIRKALGRPISVDFREESVTNLVDALSKNSGLIIKLMRDLGAGPFPEKLTMRCEQMPLGAVLQLLEDSLPGYSIVVRDYGLLITRRSSMPPGAISVQEFMRQKPPEK